MRSVVGIRFLQKEAWQHTLEQHGVTPEDFVVLYDDGFPYAARAWWLFKWIGHERVVVLEGGFSSYLAFDLPVTDDVPTYEPSQYTPRFQDEMLVSFEELKDQLTETMVIDSHAPIDTVEKSNHSITSPATFQVP